MGREVFCEGRHGEAEDGNLLAPLLHHHIGLEVGLTRSGIHHVGPKDGEVRLTHEAVVDTVTGLNVVVADRHRIVAEVIVHLGYRMGGGSIYHIIVIGEWLPLQEVPRIEEQHRSRLGTLAVRADDRSHTCHAATGISTLQYTLREERSVYVTGLEEIDRHHLAPLPTADEAQREEEGEEKNKSLHTQSIRPQPHRPATPHRGGGQGIH